MFRFLHAADIHLDSPLRGLEKYEGAPVDEIRHASRRALENLVKLAMDEQVAFVLITGDLYDADWPDFNTGLFFNDQMEKLGEAGIPVFLTTGNHDAANRMTRALKLPRNVTRLPESNADTARLDDIGVAIHGQGYATHAITADLSKEYPSRAAGYFNIGMLHTCAEGVDDQHERYAPCTVAGLRSKEYDYWALGHIHKRSELSVDPPIVFPGNIQGRHIRESGPKGCSLVTVNGGKPRVEHRELDVIRWETCQVSALGAEDTYEILDRFAERLSALAAGSNDRPLILRVEVSGSCPVHEKIIEHQNTLQAEIRSRALSGHFGRVWVEKVRLATTRPTRLDRTTHDGPIGEMLQYFEELRTGVSSFDPLRVGLKDLKNKLASEFGEGTVGIDLESPEALRNLLEQVEQVLVNRLG
jgi:DNA repair protein SbcD/Mre11